MLGLMVFNEERSDPRLPASVPGRRIHAWAVLGILLLSCILFLAYEEALNLVALSLFPHHDSATCAGANTFCSPDSRAGLTPGAVLFLVANLAAGVVFTLALMERKQAKTARG